MRQGAPKAVRAFALVEMLAVMAVIAILLGMGFSVYRGARLAARIAVAENNLKQTSTALELYFRRFGHYPPQRCDLVAELTPFVYNPEVFSNPLIEERVPGETLSKYYFPLASSEGEGTKSYVTAFTSDDGHTAVVLYSGGKIEVPPSINYIPNNPGNFIHIITGLDVISGPLNLDPRNNTNCDFAMGIDSGGMITRSQLLGSGGEANYTGRITWVRTWPKGTGNQNYIFYNGVPYYMLNGRNYVMSPTRPEGRFNVKLCNGGDSSSGQAMGDYWIDLFCIGAQITEVKGK